MNWRYVARRLAQVPIAVLAVLAVTFAVVSFLPGDPAASLAGETASLEQIQEVRHAYGLDRPKPLQFLSYVGRLAHGDLGYSYGRGQPVARVIRDFAKPTLLLTGTALIFSLLFGIALAKVAMRQPFGWRDKLINGTMLVAYAVPSFFLAEIAISWLVLKLRLFPLQGYSRFGRGAPTGAAHLADVAYHLMLPAMILAVTEVAAITRVVRSGLLNELGAGYVRTAQAKGLSEDEIMSQHTLRNAIRPLVTLIGTRVGFLLSGAAIIESMFTWPGLGRLLVVAVDSADRPLMLGMTLVVSLAIVLANLVTDLVYRWIDPRIDYG